MSKIENILGPLALTFLPRLGGKGGGRGFGPSARFTVTSFEVASFV